MNEFLSVELIDMDKWAKKLKPITNSKPFKNSSYTKDGLFSQQIFGPVKSYCCACKTNAYRGKRNRNKKCHKCQVVITSSDTRRQTFAKIELPFPILNPLFYFLAIKMKTTSKEILTNFLEYKERYYFNDEGELIKIPKNADVEKNIYVLEGLDGAIKYIENLSENKLDDASEFIRDNKKALTISNVIVIPPKFRPCNRDSSGKFIMDNINKLYNQILIRSNLVKRSPVDMTDTDNVDIYKMNFVHLQKYSLELYNYVLDKLSKKDGLIRSNILGKRVDFSGRAVITPNPKLSLSECAIPYFMMLEIVKPQLTGYLVRQRVKKTYKAALDLIEECIKNRDFELYDHLCNFAKGKYCILNRQPTLHRLGMLGFEITITKGNTIEIPPMITAPFNADFDGDCMALYFPVNEESVKDVKEKLGVWNNLTSVSNGQLMAEPSQDIVLGIYRCTNDKVGRKVNCKDTMMPSGLQKFNKVIEEYIPISSAVDKKTLYLILNRLSKIVTPERMIEILNGIKDLGFEYSTNHGYTLGLDDIYSEELELYNKKKLKGDYTSDGPVLKSKELRDKLKKLRISTYIESGARGSWDQAQQLAFSRGYVADSTNMVRSDLVRSSLVCGLNQVEYFNSSWGTRKGLLDTALSTGDSGYITRQLIYANSTTELASEEDCEQYPDLNDCGTTDGIEMTLLMTDSKEIVDVKKTKDLIRSLVGRYYTEDNFKTLNVIPDDERIIQSLIGKKIKLRSPIYCKNVGICKKCYGDNYKRVHGTQIGIIAAQSIGERLTQLILRTFHVSGSVSSKTSNKSSKNDDIISGMKLVKQILHSPKSFVENDTPNNLLMAMYKLFQRYGNVYMVHYEVIISCMMWADDDFWRLHEDRGKVKCTYHSILQVPSMVSWLIGCAFSNVKTKLLDALIGYKVDHCSSLSKLFRL